MGWCAAVGCKNSKKKGFIMKYFPKEPTRRKQWVENMGRQNFVPTRYSVLCEKHFAPEMWEKIRGDGSKKLKLNAVPTIFDKKSTSETPELEEVIEIRLEEGSTDSDSEEATSPKRCKLVQSNEADTDEAVELSFPNTAKLLQGPELIISKEKIAAEQTALLAQNYAILLVPRTIPFDPAKLLQNEIKDGQQQCLQPKPIALAPTSNGVFQITTPLPFAGITMIDRGDTQNRLDNKETDITNDRQSNMSCDSDSPHISKAKDVNTETSHSEINCVNSINDNNQTLSISRSIVDTIKENTCQFSQKRPKSHNCCIQQEIVDDDFVDDGEGAELNVNSESELSDDNGSEIALLESDDTEDSDDSKTVDKECSMDSKALSKLNKKDVMAQRLNKCNKLKKAVLRYRSKMRIAKQQIRMLISQLEENHHTKLINHVFNPDQVRALGQAIKGKSMAQIKWSDDTIANSLQLKLACGNKGYEEILRQNLPYPSIRTLQRAIAVPAEAKDTS